MRERIESSPVPAFFVGIVCGALLILLRSYLYPVLVIGVIAFAGFWLFASDESKPDSSTSDRPAPDQAS